MPRTPKSHEELIYKGKDSVLVVCRNRNDAEPGDTDYGFPRRPPFPKYRTDYLAFYLSQDHPDAQGHGGIYYFVSAKKWTKRIGEKSGRRIWRIRGEQRQELRPPIGNSTGMRVVHIYTTLEQLKKARDVSELSEDDGSVQTSHGGKERTKPRAAETDQNWELSEGGAAEVKAEIAYRNPRLRKMVLAEKGSRCVVCGKDPTRIFGDWGKSCIEIHHLRPISKSKKKRRTVTINDVEAICANCHRVIHHGGREPLPLDVVRKRISREA